MSASSSKGKEIVDVELGDGKCDSPRFQTPSEPQVKTETRWEDKANYRSLRRCISQGKWRLVTHYLQHIPGGIKGRITEHLDTPFLFAAKMQGKGAYDVLERLAGLLPDQSGLSETDVTGSTALHSMAMLGNLRGADWLVGLQPDLPDMVNHHRHLPIHWAANHGQRKMLLFLLPKTKFLAYLGTDHSKHGEHGATILLRSVMNYQFYDVALYLLGRFHWLASLESSPFVAIAEAPSAFPSGTKLSSWQRLIYSHVPVEMNLVVPNSLDGEGMVNHVSRKLHDVFWHLLKLIVPQTKNIQHKKWLHKQAYDLANSFCLLVAASSESSETPSILGQVLLLGAQHGIHEVVDLVLSRHPNAMSFRDANRRSALHLAVMYRQENVFNYLNSLKGELKQHLLNLSKTSDVHENNILHLAGSLPHQQQLDLVSTAVLQMQRELQWFQEVEKFVSPQQRRDENKDKKNPLEIFVVEHREMITNETQWMIGMATSCTVATTIIGTIAFSAAITVPGGTTGNGLPVFSGEPAFKIFAISNALALFSSVATLLIFLSIFTSRYAAIDFLFSLPNKLIIGLLALFLSITSMLIAFSATLYLMYAQKNDLILIPIAFLGLLPVSLFAFLQFPLLKNMIKSTYGPSMFLGISEQTNLDN